MKMIKIKDIKRTVIYLSAVGISIFLLFFVIVVTYIGYDVKRQCEEAQAGYKGDCVEVLMQVLDDGNRDFRARNSAIWALGQLGDKKALPLLQKYYTGNIPPREPLDKMISQYELRKAINLANGDVNISSYFWRYGLNTK